VLENHGFTDIKFTHLPPINSVAGSGNPAGKMAKNMYYWFALIVDKLSLGRINIDNLFAEAKKK